MSSIVPLPVVVPLAGAALLLLFGGLLPGRVARALTIAAALGETVLAGALVHGARSAPLVYWFGGWTPRHGTAIGVSFVVDRLGAGAAAFAGIIVTAALLSAGRAFGDRVLLTHALLLTMLAAMAGFCLTGDLFNMFVFYELMAVSAFALAAFTTTDAVSLRAALNFAITNSIGAFLLLIGIALLYGRTGALNLAGIGRGLAATPHVDGLVIVALTTIAIGFLVKAAVVPFHFWLVDIATSGPLPLVLIFAGALDTLAVFGLARVYWTAFAPALGAHDRALQVVLITFGACSALIGSSLSLFAGSRRRTLAFVLISHTGTLLIGVGCLTSLGLAGAAIYALADGVIKVALFAAVAMIDGDGDAIASGVAPVVLLTVGGLALAGTPLFGIAFGESVIERAAVSAGNPWVVPVLFIASVLTGAAVLRIALQAARARRPRRTPESLAGVATLLVGVAIAARFVLSRWVAGGAAVFVASTAYGRAVLDGVAFAPVAAIGGIRLSVGEQAVDLLAVVSALAVVAWVELVRPKTRRVAEAPGAVAISRAVNRVHSGSPGDSVVWVVSGATAFAAVLAVAWH